MYNKYENSVTATIALLQQLKIKVNKSTVNETLHNHSDYPSLLSISDALTRWDVPNTAAKLESKDIDQLPVPFIAHTLDRNDRFIVVNKYDDNEVSVFSGNYNKTISLSKEEFLKKWDGIFLLAETTKASGEKDYERIKLNYFIAQFIPALAIGLVAIFSFILVQHNINLAAGLFSETAGVGLVSVYVQYFLLLAGVFVTVMLLWYEIDKNNPLLNKVCTGIIKGNCNAIVTGRSSKVFSWLSWSETGFFYFAGSFLCIMFDPANPFPYIFNLLALPYIFFSIYYQGVIAKQWCLLCLVVQALLLSGGINIMVNALWRSYSYLNFQTIATAFGLYLFPVLLWYSLKSLVLRLQTAKQTRREYLRFKFSEEIFTAHLQKQKTVSRSSMEGLGIDIGNPHAEYTIIKVCNPYCGPCAKAHPVIEKIIEHNPNVKVKIIFTATTDEADHRNKPVTHLLAIADRSNEKLTKQALDDWYLAEEKNYDVFAKKYPLNGEIAQKDNKIEAMHKWCNEADIEFTPTIFISHPSSSNAGQRDRLYQLPDAYSVDDINYFFPG
jgi:hypothetical protein